MAGGSEGRGKPPEAAVLRFQFQGAAAGLRGHEAAPEMVTLPAEPLVQDVAPVPDAISRARWISGALLTAFLTGIGVWLMLLPSSTLSHLELPEREDGAPVGEPLQSANEGVSASPAPAMLIEASTRPSPSAPEVPPSASPLEDASFGRRPERRPAPSTRPKVRPVISIESAASSGGLTPVDIRSVLDPLRADLRRCLASEIERGHDIRQTVVVKMAVRGSGVESVISTMRSPRLWFCIRNLLASVKFHRHQGYTDVTLSLRLGSP